MFTIRISGRIRRGRWDRWARTGIHGRIW